MSLRFIALGTLPAAAVLLAAGCATMRNGTSQRVAVTSSPPGAEVYVNGQPAGITPTEVTVSRRREVHRIRVGSETRRIRRRFSPWAALDVPMGFLAAGLGITYLSDGGDSGIPVRHGMAVGLVPIVVDLLTGGAYSFPRRAEFSAPSGRLRTQRPLRPAQLDGFFVRPSFEFPQLRNLVECRIGSVHGDVQ